ncbi:hypothetical protein [Pedobacter glucosidilyticus]|uniref:hypothetical protein n=1 Tax=Pedobacter glucosidilyticus TaxID=1122941 RepID=UPI0004173316|nr:hypothetical protein [Pedobacter glucosidilyticus]
MNPKYKAVIFIALVALLSACGLNRQKRELKALEDCKYQIVSADSIYIAGLAIKEFSSADEINLAKLPSVALGFLRKNIPLTGKVNLQISNPTAKQASINQFDYIILIKDRELISGLVDQKISIAPGSTIKVPIHLKANIYQLVADPEIQQEVFDFLNTNQERKGLVTIKIKPTITIGHQQIKYPGYISIDKELSNQILL